MAKWLVKVVGKLPEKLEIEAPNMEEAENDALNEVFAAIEILVEPIETRLYVVPKKEKTPCQQVSEAKTTT